jgi:hypothetical protein
MLLEPPLAVLLLALASNAAAGIVFGWLFWKRGLEAAMGGHIIAHLIGALGNTFAAPWIR